MRSLRPPVFAVLAIIAIAACSKRDPVADDANAAAASLPTVNRPTADSTGAPPPHQTAPAGKPVEASATIPTRLQGRWGLTPGDCISTRGDAKGLLVVSGNEMRFYESRAVPADGIEHDADSMSGNFAFTGEGQSWTRYEALKLANHKLIRTESKPTASFTYARC
jgi:hypothetical protein